MWTACVLTIFPEMFPGPLGLSLAGQALGRGDWQLDAVNIREFGVGKHRTVDDTPAGGGPGMVMRPDVVAAAIDSARERHPELPLFYLSPRGNTLTQGRVRSLAEKPGVMLLCGRFEGVDQRVIEARGAEELSVGDYVLSGGEPAAMVMIDAIVRLLPGVMGAVDSAAEESFENNLLEYPQYTRPRKWEDRDIPEVLLSGDHAAIAAWRRHQAAALTRMRRPDLLPPSFKGRKAGGD
jgi:tRNA (guanine37-N1)-methyltransferase